MERISVIVPIYKVEPYLDRCIRSIATQTYENLEIILVDDGSPDNCPAICDAWVEKDSRIKVIHKKNGGLSDARNAGMDVATGEFISFIDSDDSIEPVFLEQLYHALITHDADIAECAVSFVDEEGTVLRQRSAADLKQMDKLEALRRLVLEDGVHQTVWNKLYRRDAAIDIPFSVGKYNEDEFWTYQVFDRIEKLAIVPQPLYNYLQRSASIIGVGYNIRRLDGLEARFQRMEYLQKYEALADMTRQLLMLDCMWNYQAADRVLEGTDRLHALKVIWEMFQKIAPVTGNASVLSVKHRCWLWLFRVMPDVTVKVRNMIGIGI